LKSGFKRIKAEKADGAGHAVAAKTGQAIFGWRLVTQSLVLCALIRVEMP
jgi:hypothetical protein